MFVLAEGAAPVVDPGSAGGVFSLLWLVIALPALGAAILLVGGPLAKGRPDEAGRPHAHNRQLLPVDGDLLSDDGRVRPELGLPVGMAEDRDRGTSDHLVVDPSE